MFGMPSQHIGRRSFCVWDSTLYVHGMASHERVNGYEALHTNHNRQRFRVFALRLRFYANFGTKPGVILKVEGK